MIGIRQLGDQFLRRIRTLRASKLHGIQKESGQASRAESPSPLVGEGRGGGANVSPPATPTLTLPPQRGREMDLGRLRSMGSFINGFPARALSSGRMGRI